MSMDWILCFCDDSRHGIGDGCKNISEQEEIIIKLLIVDNRALNRSAVFLHNRMRRMN